jgi:uncharacterized iron-regulated protein
MKNSITLLVLALMSIISYGQDISEEFKTIVVNKKIKDFRDTIDLSSPLLSCISINYISIKGKNSLWREVSTVRLKESMPDSTVPDSEVTEERKSRILETTIKEIIYYKDSVACAITEIRDSLYSIRYFYLEFDKWVQGGENGRKSLEASRQEFAKSAEMRLQLLQRTTTIAKVPTDTAAFIKYLKKNSSNPKEFILSKLNKYKLVQYGEVHRRKASWDLLQEVAKDKRFANSTGVIFMEMASHKQKDIDSFFANDTINTELLLEVFREYMDIGWNDKGMFDFVKCIWQINRNLPENKKIKLIAADTPRPFSSFLSGSDMNKNDSKYDRDEFMANTVMNYLESKKDNRNALFIVGTGHTCKTTKSAGSLLSKKMSQDLYTIFQHSPRVKEGSDKYERIRYGIFDYAFYKLGDKPKAFDLKGSPFGKEPFDGLNYEGSGTYLDNYDGYIFFGSLDDEPHGECLYDLYSDKFILEMDRRLHLEGSSLVEDWGLKELSKKAVIEHIMASYSKTMWGNSIKPLKNGKTIQ